jgi:hypothetical protein
MNVKVAVAQFPRIPPQLALHQSRGLQCGLPPQNLSAIHFIRLAKAFGDGRFRHSFEAQR